VSVFLLWTYKIFVFNATAESAKDPGPRLRPARDRFMKCDTAMNGPRRGKMGIAWQPGKYYINGMNEKTATDRNNEYCNGQCGYGPHCSECLKEKQRKWDEYLIGKVRGQESADNDDQRSGGGDGS
jgi:hypothetical protein